MKPSFSVRVVDIAVIQEIDGAWNSDDYKAILEACGFEDTNGLNDTDLRDMCVLSLQELRPEEAATLVLNRHLGDWLTHGQIRNLSNELQDEKLWEEYADMSLHERMFNVGSLLYMALPDSFPDPDAVRVKLEVVAKNGPAKEALTDLPRESFLVRLLADGMGDRATLHRMFEDQLAGPSFPEADTIIWITNSTTKSPDKVEIEVISSGYWLDALRETKSYDSSAYADDQAIGLETAD